MSKLFKPVFDYKLSFDPNKGEKYTIKVVYTVAMDAQGRIGAAIPPPAAGEDPPALTYKTQTRSADVRICQSTALDEVLSTVEMFKRARKVTRMNWADAILNFSNCLGPIPQLRLDELYDDGNYPQTEFAFNGLLNMFIRNLCLDEDAKGTLKQSIERGNWTKPEDTEIRDHNTKVIHLFNWIDQVPGFSGGAMSDAEKHRLYVSTFPSQWAKRFQSQRGFTNATTYESIDEFMQTQKDEADRSKRKRKKEEEGNNNRRNNNQRRNGGNRNNHNHRKIRVDRKARSGPTSKCKKHPDSNHAWGDCHLNPNNPNNKLGNRNSDRDRGYNRNGNYDRNNQRYNNRNSDNRQQRQSFYEDDRRLPPPPPRDNYSNQGPPSQVSVYSNQSNNDQGGRWSRVWIPS